MLMFYSSRERALAVSSGCRRLGAALTPKTRRVGVNHPPSCPRPRSHRFVGASGKGRQPPRCLPQSLPPSKQRLRDDPFCREKNLSPLSTKSPQPEVFCTLSAVQRTTP